MTETKIVEIHISEIFKWLALIMFLAVLAWWVLGDSPTTGVLGTVMAFVGLIMAWLCAEDIKTIKANTFKTAELQQKILDKLEK